MSLNRTEFYNIPSHQVTDTVLGVIYLLCFILGVPANTLSVCYFTRQRLKSMDLPTYLYTLTAVQDIIICLLSLNHGVTMLRSRDVWLPGFCAAHHVLFQMSQRMSVFLVATLSVSRTYTLVYPLKRVNRRIILTVLAVVWVLMTCFFVIPPSIKVARISYYWNDAYCWAAPIPEKNISITWDKIDSAMDTAGLVFPVLPITLSCIVSAYKIRASVPHKIGFKHFNRPKPNVNSSGNPAISRFTKTIRKGNHKATQTIIIITALYIISNLPLCINYVLYLITIIYFTYPGPLYSNTVMYYYSWNVTALLTTGLNATANPIVYITRFRRFRLWIKRCYSAGDVTAMSTSSKRVSTARVYSKSQSPVRPESVESELDKISPIIEVDSIVIPNLNVSSQLQESHV